MARVFFYSPHPDDETLSMGLAMLYYIANNIEVHLVSVTNGSALGVANTLNGSTDAAVAVSCTIAADHPYIHSPAREGYPLVTPATRLTAADIGALRNEEARSALAMMAMVPPVVPGVIADVVHHVENLPADFAGSGPSSTSPPTLEGIALAKATILPYVQNYPNSFHYTMSPADHHHDHAACGIALREIKTENPNLLGTPHYFVSRLYWATSQPDGHYQQDLLDAANGSLAWFNYSGANYTRFCDWLRNQVVPVYRAWSPGAGAYGIGYHQVSSQFNNNFGPTASIANLWHT